MGWVVKLSNFGNEHTNSQKCAIHPPTSPLHASRKKCVIPYPYRPSWMVAKEMRSLFYFCDNFRNTCKKHI